MINLELPEKLTQTQKMAQQLASGVFRPIARKYDAIEHCDTPEELKPVAQMIASSSYCLPSAKMPFGVNRSIPDSLTSTRVTLSLL